MAVSDILSRVRIKAMLIGDRRVGTLEIDVDVHGGTATLTGEVESEEQKTIAEQLAREIEGIIEVDNELQVIIEAPPMMADYESRDVPPHWILPTEEAGINIGALTENIERRIAEDGRITSKDINVTVDNGVARLAGKVDSLEESYLVQEAAESVAGIREVQNDLEIDEGHKGHTCNCGRM